MDMYVRCDSLYPEGRPLVLDLISDNFVTPSDWDLHGVFV